MKIDGSGQSAKTKPIKANFRKNESPLPGVVGRESSPKADKIALKIYPFGIDCPIVYIIFGIRLWLN